ncbi:MAG: Gfo/Idh/MocA family oxidoreductase [Acidobacteria bacterium]|nr:Gfo/Idh/MocA family oxidoreductase [Acidobacteriota bacterium]
MTTRIALVGLGGPTAGTYLECLGQMPEVQLAAVVEPGSSPSRETGGALQGVATFPHHRSLLEQFPAEGMVVCVSGDRRKEAVLDCIRAGKPILCENPISEALVEAREMWAISQAHDVLFGVCFPVRLSSACSRVRKQVLQGNLGNPLTVTVRTPEGNGGFSPEDTSGGDSGLRTNPGTSLVDTLRWLLDGEFTLATLMGSEEGVREPSGRLRLEMNHGTVVILENSLMDPPETVEMANAVRLEICGPRGRLDLELCAGADFAGLDPGCDRSKETPIRRMLANFVEAVRGRARVAAGGMDGLRAIEVVEAARRACKYRTAVVL